MSRVLPILVLAAGVVSYADAAPKKKRHKTDDRRPTRTTKSNMPRGFVWPPSKTMELAADECQKQLDELGISYTPAEAAGQVVRPITIDGDIGGITYTPVYRKHQVFDCQLVRTLASFAPQLYELGVREVKFGSAFRYTKVRVRGRTKNILSRHALGRALVNVALVDADGREANVKRHYKRGDELLLSVERAVNESGQFRILLTPRNDPRSHHDHFHLEANPDYTQPPTEKPRS